MNDNHPYAVLDAADEYEETVLHNHERTVEEITLCKLKNLVAASYAENKREKRQLRKQALNKWLEQTEAVKSLLTVRRMHRAMIEWFDSLDKTIDNGRLGEDLDAYQEEDYA